MSRRPLVNLFDVAGITMIGIFLAAFLAIAGGKHISWDIVLVFAVVFAGALFFAKQGSPPEFFQPSSAEAWIGFGLFLTVLMFFFPWLLGYLLGLVAYYVIFAISLRAIGE